MLHSRCFKILDFPLRFVCDFDITRILTYDLVLNIWAGWSIFLLFISSLMSRFVATFSTKPSVLQSRGSQCRLTALHNHYSISGISHLIALWYKPVIFGRGIMRIITFRYCSHDVIRSALNLTTPTSFFVDKWWFVLHVIQLQSLKITYMHCYLNK